MIRRAHYTALWVSLCVSMPSAALAAAAGGVSGGAAGGAADCASSFGAGATAEDAYKLKATDIQKCVHQGWDPPPAWLPNMSAGVRGTNAGGSGGFSTGTIQAPEKPPFAAGASQSGSGAICISYGGYSLCGNVTINPGQLKKSDSNAAAAVDTGTPAATIDDNSNVTLPSNVCPITSGDTLKVTNQATKQSYYGVFGPNTWFTSTATIPLSCGGTVPLNSFQLTLVQTPTGIVRVEQWVPYIWIYKAKSSNYQQITDAVNQGSPTDTPVRLPQYLCEEYRDKEGNVHRRKSSNPLPSYTPNGQMITYNNNTTLLALQLMMQPNTTSNDFFAAPNPNAIYLKLPMVNGVPYIPRDGIQADGSVNWDACDLQSDYAQTYQQLKAGSNLSADIVIESTMSSGCSASESVCNSLAESAAPTTPTNCQTHDIFPESLSPAPGGTTVNSCEGRVQHFGLDHANLYFPPTTRVSAKPFVDSRGKQWPKFPNAKQTGDPTVDFYMVSTNSGSTQNPSRLIVASDSAIQLGQSNNVFLFPNGATIGDSAGNRIVMAPDSTLDMARLVATMPNGGVKNTKSGEEISNFANGTTYSLAGFSLPLRVKVSRDMDMPSNYVIPTQSQALVREPAPAAD